MSYKWTTMVYHTMEYFSEIKRNELPSHENTRIHLICLFLVERRQYEKIISFIITLVSRQNCANGKQSSVWQGSKNGRVNLVKLRGVGKLFCSSLMVDTRHDECVKTHRPLHTGWLLMYAKLKYIFRRLEVLSMTCRLWQTDLTMYTIKTSLKGISADPRTLEINCGW